MRNTTGNVQNIIIKDVYYDALLNYNLISLTDMSKSNYATTFSQQDNKISGPLGTFDLIKTCGVYALPIVVERSPNAMGAGCVEKSAE